MTYFFGFLIGILGISVIFTLLSYLHMKTALAREYGKAAEGFFVSVKPLVADDETPVEILETIQNLNSMISEPRSARMLLAYLADDRWRPTKHGERNKIYVEFFHRRPELEEPCKSAFAYWFRAVTCLSPFFGKMVRVAIDERNVDRAVTTVSSKKRDASFENNHCPPHFSAPA